MPGKYTAELKVGGQTSRQPLTVELDPRVHVSPADLADQLDLAQRVTRGMKASSDAYQQVANLRKVLTERTDALKKSESKETKEAVAAFEKKIDAIDNGTRLAPGLALSTVTSHASSSAWRALTFALLTRSSPRSDKAAMLSKRALANLQQLNEHDLVAFNAFLAANKQASLPSITGIGSTGCKP